MKNYYITIIRISLLAGYLTLPTQAHAQEQPTVQNIAQIIVTLHDADRNAVSGAVLLVRDATTEAIEAQATTDAAGNANLHGVRYGEKHLFVQGMVANGTPLRHASFEVEGILLFVEGPQLQVDLLVEPSGVIVPNPVTMISPDIAIDALPTPSVAVLPSVTPRAISTRTPSATATPALMASMPPALISTPTAQASAASHQPSTWMGMGLLSLALAIGVVVFRGKRRH